MPSKSHKWNKIDSLTPELRRRAVKKWDKSVKVEQYRMEPPPGMAFGAIGSFHWPAAEYPPDDVFGLLHEALDPIRMSCKCFVLYNRATELFRIIGTVANVQLALQLMRKTFFQLAARSISNIRLYLLHWPNASAMPTHVKLIRHEPVAIRGDSPPGSVKSPCAAGRDLTRLDVLPGEDQTASSHNSLRKALMQILPKLHYHRGTISMRLTLGTLVTEQFRRLPENGHEEVGYKLDEYVGMIRESQFKGSVTEA
nr:hypothetical protein CFP56_00908 [Quercus suber]